MPSFFGTVGIVAAVVVVAFQALAVYNGEIGAAIAGCLFLLVAAFLIMLYFNHRIYYDDNGFTVKSFFGFKKRYKYGDITSAVLVNGSGLLYAGNKKITVETDFKCGLDFYVFVCEKYSEQHDGQNIPNGEKPTNDIFNGRSRDKGVSFIMVSVIVLLLSGGMAGLFVYMFVMGREDALPLMPVFGLLFFGAVAYTALCIKVGRNPTKYSKRLVDFLFQKGYIEYKD